MLETGDGTIARSDVTLTRSRFHVASKKRLFSGRLASLAARLARISAQWRRSAAFDVSENVEIISKIPPRHGNGGRGATSRMGETSQQIDRYVLSKSGSRFLRLVVDEFRHRRDHASHSFAGIFSPIRSIRRQGSPRDSAEFSCQFRTSYRYEFLRTRNDRMLCRRTVSSSFLFVDRPRVTQISIIKKGRICFTKVIYWFVGNFGLWNI